MTHPPTGAKTTESAPRHPPQKGTPMLKGFKDFIAQGNALELAVAVIIGAAFKPIVDAITAVIMGIIGAVIGSPNFDSVGQFTINGSDPIQPGAIVTAIVNFLLIAIAVYFCIVLPMNKLKEARANTEVEEEAVEVTDTELLVQIRDLLAGGRANVTAETTTGGGIETPRA